MANYTRKAIEQTFEEMLREMPFDRITVSALVARCKISPNTFYYHYRDIYDLLDTWLDGKKNAFLADAAGQSWSETFQAFLLALQRQPELVYHISGSISRDRLERYVFTSIKSAFYDYATALAQELQIDPEVMRGIADFSCYVFLGASLEFIWGRMTDDVEQLVGRMSAAIDGALDFMLEKAKQQAAPPDEAGRESV